MSRPYLPPSPTYEVISNSILDNIGHYTSDSVPVTNIEGVTVSLPSEYMYKFKVTPDSGFSKTFVTAYAHQNNSDDQLIYTTNSLNGYTATEGDFSIVYLSDLPDFPEFLGIFSSISIKHTGAPVKINIIISEDNVYQYSNYLIDKDTDLILWDKYHPNPQFSSYITIEVIDDSDSDTNGTVEISKLSVVVPQKISYDNIYLTNFGKSYITHIGLRKTNTPIGELHVSLDYWRRLTPKTYNVLLEPAEESGYTYEIENPSEFTEMSYDSLQIDSNITWQSRNNDQVTLNVLENGNILLTNLTSIQQHVAIEVII